MLVWNGCYVGLVGLTWMSCGFDMGAIWFSHGCHVVLTWVLCGFDMGDVWVSHGAHMGFMWLSYGFHVGAIWVLCDWHVGAMWFPYGFHVIAMWFSHGCHVGFMWLPCGRLVTTVIRVYDYQCAINAHQSCNHWSILCCHVITPKRWSRDRRDNTHRWRRDWDDLASYDLLQIRLWKGIYIT